MGTGSARRLMLEVKAHGYGERTARMQALLQQGLVEVLDRAAARARLDRTGWNRLPGGDGELAVLPPDEPESRVVDPFVRQLNAALLEHNRLAAPEARLRLRLAIHFGPAHEGATGFAGAGPVVARRLCDSPAARRALDESEADLVVIVSAQVFGDTIAEQLTSLEEGDLCEVGFRGGSAWLWTPGHRPPSPGPEKEDPRPEPSAPPGPPAAGPYAGARIEIHGDGYVAGRDVQVHRHGGGK